MKKTLFTTLAILVSCMAFAQDNYEYRLKCVKSSDNLDSVRFFYNENNWLISYDMVTPNDDNPLRLIDSLTYDDRGNVLKSNVYQKMDNGWMNSTYIEYTYDENNNRITRTNYNNFGSGFQIQGVYTYTYENGLLTYHEMTLGGSLYEKCYYTYNDAGYLVEEKGENYDMWYENWANSYKTAYHYDDNNNCTGKDYYYWNENAWNMDTQDVFTFDADNNCSTYVHYQEGNITDRYTYFYDTDTDIENVLMPIHPEPFYTSFVSWQNLPIYYSWEAADENWVLHPICDFNFLYDVMQPNAIPQILASDGLRIFPNPAQSSVTVNLDGLKNIEIINAEGVSVYQAKANSDFMPINISSLKSGFYFIKSFDGKRWYTEKLVVE